MNERIKELMSKTLDEKFAGTWSTMDMQDLAKFSEREDIIRATPHAFSWLSTKQVCQRWSAFYAAIG